MDAHRFHLTRFNYEVKGGSVREDRCHLWSDVLVNSQSSSFVVDFWYSSRSSILVCGEY